MLTEVFEIRDIKRYYVLIESDPSNSRLLLSVCIKKKKVSRFYKILQKLVWVCESLLKGETSLPTPSIKK